MVRQPVDVDLGLYHFIVETEDEKYKIQLGLGSSSSLDLYLDYTLNQCFPNFFLSPLTDFRDHFSSSLVNLFTVVQPELD